jgi:endonuclease/exonuclease/phosphatase family metal-dependent hydrolase
MNIKLLSKIICIIIICIFNSNHSLAQNPSSPKQISILSWNMYLLPAIAPVKGRITRASLIANELNNSGYDILCLQEAFHHKAVAILQKELKTIYPYQYGPIYDSKNKFETNSGLLICSKTPFLIIDSILYRDANGIDAKAKKAAVLFQATINGKNFQVILSHMQSGKFSATRRKQFDQIKTELIDKYTKNDMPLFICGDLNTDRDTVVEYEYMLHSLDAKNHILSGEKQYSYDGKTNTIARHLWKEASTNLDYILLKNNNAPIKIISQKIVAYKKQWCKKYTDLSDHYGVECIFELY